MEDNLIRELRAQHKRIEKQMTNISTILHSENINFQKLFELAVDFKKKLFEHLDLENTRFYPTFFKKLEELGEDVEQYQSFSKQITDILNSLKSTVDEYTNLEKLQTTDIETLKSDFEKVRTNLEIRINVEELFLYRKMLDI